MTERAIAASLSRLRDDMAKGPDPPGIELLEVAHTSWCFAVFGPEGTPYEDGTFRFTVTFPETYPFACPEFKLLTRIYHWNMGEKSDAAPGCGEYCCAVNGIYFRNHIWSPALCSKLFRLMQNVVAELKFETTPHVEGEIYREYRENYAAFERTAREWTEKYACGTPPVESSE